MGDKKGGDKNDEDARLEHILQYLIRSSKIKADKWAKVLSTDELRVSIFIENIIKLSDILLNGFGLFIIYFIRDIPKNLKNIC